MFAAPLGESIVGKAAERGLIEVRTHNIRDYAEGRHQVTDDRPFGGRRGERRPEHQRRPPGLRMVQ